VAARKASAGFDRSNGAGGTRVRILDRQRYWAFLKAYVICYISLVGLYIVIDAFSNLDEFSKRAEGVVETLLVMGRFYLIHQSLFFDQLSGVIGMMAAIFTVTFMQRNNEQLAMLAAGISTHRAIRPVLFSSVIVGGITVANQEIIMPAFAEELAKTHDDDGERTVHVTGRYDSWNIYIHGVDADRASRTLLPFWAVIPKGVFGSIREIKGKQATYIPPDHPTAPLKGGWLVRDALISPLIEEELLAESSKWIVHVSDLKGFPKEYVPPEKAEGEGKKAEGVARAIDAPGVTNLFGPHSEIACFAAFPAIPLDATIAFSNIYNTLDQKVDLGRGDYFLTTTLSFQAMTRKTNWYQFATTRDLLQGLTDPSTEEGSERNDVAMFVHVRFLRPFLAMNLLLMSLPLVLGGFGRNTFINLGFALANSAMFYGGIIFCQYLGGFKMLSPALAAWTPLIAFGTVASLRWDQIRS
jgi:lipopolysaccharide export system permease protein